MKYFANVCCYWTGRIMTNLLGYDNAKLSCLITLEIVDIITLSTGLTFVVQKRTDFLHHSYIFDVTITFFNQKFNYDAKSLYAFFGPLKLDMLTLADRSTKRGGHLYAQVVR